MLLVILPIAVQRVYLCPAHFREEVFDKRIEMKHERMFKAVCLGLNALIKELSVQLSVSFQ